jgi:plastocyanin domain-containing protein
MMRALILLTTLGLVACSRGDDKERWQGPAASSTPEIRGRRIDLSVTVDGFVPTPVVVKANEPITMVITRKTDKTCAKDVVIPDYGIERKLPLDQAVAISFTPTRTGELVYGCSMDRMVSGVLTVQ